MTQSIPSQEKFPQVMEKTIQLTGEKLPSKNVKGLAKIFHSLCWEFPDYQVQVYTVLDDEGHFNYAGTIDGVADAQITMNAEQLHSVVYGRANMPKMFLTRQIKVRGLPTLKLMKFAPLLGPFLDSYKEACEALSG